MGVDTKKKAPPLPAPTETETTTPTEVTTDISKPGDEKSSYSLPEDGTPVTIRTRGHKANRSQTSLLIEYFEGGKPGSGSDRKPSVRVRLTPSKKSKGDHIQVTETKGTRKASLTRRIPLDEAIASREIQLGGEGGEDAHSMTSYASATEESNVSRNPIDIEIDRNRRRRRPASPLIPTGETYQPGNPSEISAIPTDSFLDGSGPTGELKRSASPSRVGDGITAAAAGALAGVAMGEISSNKPRGKERVKISDSSAKEKSSDRKRRSKSRTSSVSEPVADEIRSSRRRSSRGHQESNVSAADSSVLSSNLSPSHRSFDTRSMRSGASKSSINNPKLLETVEDAIRRLILPELSALKREQSKREARRGSLTSTGTSASRDDVSTDRRRSSGGHRSEHSRDPSRHKERRNREARHDLDETSLRSASHDSIDAEYRAHDGDATTPKRSNNLLKVAAAGAAGAAAAKALSSAMDDKTDSPDRAQRDRRRRRAESARSRSLGRDRYSEEYDDEDDEMAPAPPMPLMSDINPSELTRTSILSADTDRPHSASEELVSGHVAARGLDSPGSTPTRARTPADLQHTLGTKHANVSHGDLNALPRGQKGYVQEYETDEFGRKVPIGDYDDYERSRNMPEVDDYPEDDFEDRYYSQQDVPPPLKYVPYQAGARGLSPIPSVSGYTEGGSEAPRPLSSRDVHSPNALPSPGKSPEHGRYVRSAHSQDSVPSNMRSREFDRASGHSENERTAAGQAVRGLGANPDFVHPPSGVESAVASLVDGSMLEQSVMTTGSGYDYSGQRDSTISDDLHSKVDRSSRGISPDKMSTDSYHGAGEDMRAATPGSRSQAQSQDYSEYDIDEHGRKVPRTRYRHSPTASEAAITAGAVGAAAAALKAAQGRRQATVEDSADEAFQPAGVSRNKSFKERTTQHGWEPRNTPTHSVDRLDFEDQPKMAASGIPDMNSPMPEIGYMDDDLQTNPSVVEERLDGHRDEHDWSGRATPTQRDIGGYDHDGHDKGGGLGITEVAGAAALGAAAGMAAMHHDEPDELDEWQRTSEERKRDTLVTNPYEDASPIANPALDETILSGRGLDAQFHTGSPGFGQKYDEGYMSNGPVRTPDVEPKGKAIDFGTGANLGDDPFYSPQGHSRHLSGMSQGMASPFYDAATGAGIERIENKDIVALMQHLMVRDAQRSARDTEIVALLMNAALEMRNSFREMKELVQDTGDDVIFANVENTEKLQKAINGPRPYPGAASRSIQSGSQAGTIDDVAAKKKNLWRRALQGLGAKGTSDLSRIEDMLMQLLGEVDVLKMQTAQPVSTGGPGQSYENLQPEAQYEQDKGYEPEGISTASHASQSGHLAASQPKTLAPPFAGERRAVSDHRISTVEENDEEYQYDHPSPSAERMKANLLSPRRPDQVQRGGSVPPETPPQLVDRGDQHPQSAENTPRTDRGKKHKSSSSSGWLPKISRWSETTTSSVGRMLRGSGGKKGGPKYDDFQPPSRSGSSLASYEDNYRHDPYDDKLHTGFSDQNLVPEPHGRDEGPPPTSYQTPEDPKYKAHRNSVNLQHPQPRPGQTERYRTALETSAQEYSNNPTTPRSADWAGSATSLNRLHGNTTRHSNTSSAAAAATAAQEAEYWHSSPGPPRPPKEPIGSPLSPTSPRSADMARLKESSPPAQQSSESGYGTLTATHLSHYSGSSPKLENRNLSAALGVPTRRPTGPRAMTPRHPDEDAAREERRRKRDTFGTVASQDTDTF